MSAGGITSRYLSNGRLSFVQFLEIWNKSQFRTTPNLHLDISNWLQEAWDLERKRLLLLVFRDAGKSTLTGLYCAWLLRTNPDLRILVVAAEHELASRMTRNVRRIIERHPAARHLIPTRPELWASDQITIERSIDHRDPSLLARGITANITGVRADIIICDDVEVPNTSDTPIKRNELRERLAETSFILVPGGTQLYIGTPHSYYSIYSDEPRRELGESEPFLSGFDRFVRPVLDRNGKSHWPERFSTEYLEQMKLDVGPAKFRSQMMLVPTHTHDIRFNPDRIVRYENDLEIELINGRSVLRIDKRRMLSSCCWWDPAFGNPNGGDSNVIAVVFLDEEGVYWLHAITYMVFDPRMLSEIDEASQLCRQAIEFAKQYEQPTITLETNGIGKFLPSILRREAAAANQPISVRDHVTTGSKVQRILNALDPVLAAGHLKAHASIWKTPLIEEMREWIPGKGDRDDGLDALSGCLLSLPTATTHKTAIARRPDWRGFAKGWRATTEFPV